MSSQSAPSMTPAGSEELNFDTGGVRKAIIALLAALLKMDRYPTLAEALIGLEVIDSHLDGRPHTLQSLADKFDIPYTSVSRIVFGLTSEASPGGILKLVPDTRDRRRKHIELDPEGMRRVEAGRYRLARAMLDYYGDSARGLKKAQST